MANKIGNLVEIARISASPSYASAVSSQYWKRQTVSLEQLTNEQQELYFENLLTVLDPRPNQSILDYGCGAGEKSAFLLSRDYDVTGGDISENLMAVARSRGVDCHLINDLIESRRTFDLVFMHGTFMYIHPKERGTFLVRARQLLTPGGRLSLLGEPDIQKRWSGPRNPLQARLAPVLPVYQFFNASFWTKRAELEATARASGYTTFEFRDGPQTISAPDRSHYILGTS